MLVWGIVQFTWYQRGRALPENMDVEPASEGWSVARLFALFKRSSDDAGDESRAIAAVDRAGIRPADPRNVGARSRPWGGPGIALERLLDADGGNPAGESEDADAFAARKKAVSYQFTMSF